MFFLETEFKNRHLSYLYLWKHIPGEINTPDLKTIKQNTCYPSTVLRVRIGLEMYLTCQKINE